MSADPVPAQRAHYGRVRRLREPGARRRAGQERPVRDRARHEALARARPHRVQARLLRLDAVPEFHARVPPERLRDGRHPELEGVRQEQRRHPHGRRRDRPLLLEVAHRHVRARDRRQRLFAARLEAQGERQARRRLRRAQLDLGPARQQLRRVHLLRRPDPRAEAHADSPEAAEERRAPTPTSASRRRSIGWLPPLPRSRRTTIPFGARS